MYVPPKFLLNDEEAWRLVTDAGAGTLIVATSEGLESAFAPVLVSDDQRVMYSHLAKANPWTRCITPGTEVLVTFLAASAYVSPLNYPSRIENPNVVPTWNYALVQVRTSATLIDDEQWKLNQVRALTRHFEGGHDPQWLVDDMDEGFRSAQLRAIIGLELTVQSIEGKGKLSQNRPEVDRRAVHEAFDQGTCAQRLVAARMPLPE